MIPGVRPQGFSSFYGKAVPRPMGNLDALGNLRQSAANPLPAANAPLLDWSTKVDWSNGGAIMPQPIGTVPKKPVSAQGAFIAYKTRLLREQNPDLPRKSLKRLVEEKADEEWSELDDAERQIFESLSEEDSERYEKEMEEFKQSNPGWVKWHEAQLELEKKNNSDKKPTKPAARKPRPPLTPWMAYVKSQVQKRLDADPSLKAGLQLTAQVIKETAPKWRNLSDRSRQKWVRIAKADQQRFDAELVNFPEYAQKLKEKAAQKAERKAAKAAAAKQKKRKAPGAQTGEARTAGKATGAGKATAAGKAPMASRKRKGGPSNPLQVAAAVNKRGRVTRQTVPPLPVVSQATDAASTRSAKSQGRKSTLVKVPALDLTAPTPARKTPRQAAAPSGRKEGGRLSKRLQSRTPGDVSVRTRAAHAEQEGVGAEDSTRAAAVLESPNDKDVPAGGEAAKPVTPERRGRAGLRLRARRLAGMRTEEIPATTAKPPPPSKTASASAATSAQEGAASDNVENIPPGVPSPTKKARGDDSCVDMVTDDAEVNGGDRAVAGEDVENRGADADGQHGVLGQVLKEDRNVMRKSLGGSSTRAPLEPIPALPLSTNSDKEGVLVGRPVRRSFWVDGVSTPFDGTVVSYNIRAKWYRVVYSDGDQEDLTVDEVQPFLVEGAPTLSQGPKTPGLPNKA